MLAFQRPSMGSSKPPNLEMPFGYSFDTASSFPFPSPTAPAPGPSLLDDNESKFLDNFFDGVSSDHFNYDFFASVPDGSDVGFGWDELPPAFMGTSSSFGQQPQAPSHGLPIDSFGNMNPQMSTTPPVPPTTPADVLAAATLLQNGSAGRSHSMVDGNMFSAHETPPSNGHARPHSMSYAPRRSQGMPQRRQGTEDFMRDNYYKDMVFGSNPESSMRRRGPSQQVDIRWGSDAGFGSPQGFMAPPTDQDKMAASERSHIQAVEGLFTLDTSSQLPSSAENTRPSSPARARPTVSHARTKSTSRNEQEEEEEEDQDSRPRKRRKSKYPDEGEEEDGSAAPKAGGKKRKPAKKGANESSATESEQKRRKSAAASAAAAKASRENLTEDQKRENHIKSEQKRRTLIREGFEDLGELVPGLKGGGFSKSAVLIMAADWLEDLIQGNRDLQGRLNQLEGR